VALFVIRNQWIGRGSGPKKPKQGSPADLIFDPNRKECGAAQASLWLRSVLACNFLKH